jgi:hypothetical protein
MFGFLLKAIAAVAAVGAGVLALHHSAPGGSVSAGMQAGPVCITQTAHPGNSYSAPVSVVGNGTMHLSAEQIGPPAGPPYPEGGHPLPASWLSYSGTSQVTVSVPGNAKPGRYGALLVATNYGGGGNGSGTQVALGAAAGTWLEVSVGVSPPPRLFCTGQRPTYWPYVPVNWCKPGIPVSRAAPCTARPLHPPVASAKHCHMTHAAWSAYMGQLALGGFQRDAHCYVNGELLNTLAYYKSTHAYRN